MHFARLVEQASATGFFATYRSITDLVATYLSMELTIVLFHNIPMQKQYPKMIQQHTGL